MKILNKIVLGKKDINALNTFYNLCTENLELDDYSIIALLKAIHGYENQFETNSGMYDIEYTDWGVYTP